MPYDLAKNDHTSQYRLCNKVSQVYYFGRIQIRSLTESIPKYYTLDTIDLFAQRTHTHTLHNFVLNFFLMFFETFVGFYLIHFKSHCFLLF